MIQRRLVFFFFFKFKKEETPALKKPFDPGNLRSWFEVWSCARWRLLWSSPFVAVRVPPKQLSTANSWSIFFILRRSQFWVWYFKLLDQSILGTWSRSRLIDWDELHNRRVKANHLAAIIATWSLCQIIRAGWIWNNPRERTLASPSNAKHATLKLFISVRCVWLGTEEARGSRRLAEGRRQDSFGERGALSLAHVGSVPVPSPHFLWNRDPWSSQVAMHKPTLLLI
jgi:hypothetical protein